MSRTGTDPFYSMYDRFFYPPRFEGRSSETVVGLARLFRPTYDGANVGTRPAAIGFWRTSTSFLGPVLLKRADSRMFTAERQDSSLVLPTEEGGRPSLLKLALGEKTRFTRIFPPRPSHDGIAAGFL